MPKEPRPTQPPRERALLVGTERHDLDNLLPMQDSLRELALLAETAGLSVVGEATQRIDHPDPKTFIGSGKVQEVRMLVQANQADMVLFDDELSPRHQRELERALGEEIRVVDRTALILDVFAQHANTREGALQVELAQYEYRLPRLTRAWTHLARQAGGGAGRTGSVGGVGLRGPGETQLEADRRDIGRRISQLKEELEKVRAHRGRHRARRRRAEIPTLAMVGYTNAGKSTLLNRLTHAEVYVADQLFATLDPTTRRLELPGGRQALLTDTVGFIQKLPTMLVAAFRATLEEIAEADLLLHVVDVTHRNAAAQARAVMQTLEALEASELPMVTALNKVDLLADRVEAAALVDQYDRAVLVSALTGEGLPSLLAALEHELYERMEPIQVEIPYQDGRWINLFHEQGVVEQLDHGRELVRIRGRLPLRLMRAFKRYRPGRDIRQAALEPEAAD
jgi:GTP-binding protein HflX